MPKYLVAFWGLLLAACQMTPEDPACVPTPQEKKAWAIAQKTETADGYRAFLQKFPNGCYAESAAQKIRKPVKPVPVKPVSTGGGKPAPTPTPY